MLWDGTDLEAVVVLIVDGATDQDQNQDQRCMPHAETLPPAAERGNARQRYARE